MRVHLAYLSYVLRHKWYVLLECIKLGIPWRGLVHDWHKFLPDEWFPYVHFFHNPDGTEKQVHDETGYYKPDDTGDPRFDMAWFLHQKRAYHHWQSWCFPSTGGGLKAMPMLDGARREMLADWRGAARAQGLSRDNTRWYVTNRDKMILHPETRLWIEKQFGIKEEAED